MAKRSVEPSSLHSMDANLESNRSDIAFNIDSDGVDAITVDFCLWVVVRDAQLA